MKTEKLFEVGRNYFMQTFGDTSNPSLFFFKKINDEEIVVKKSIGPTSTKINVKFNGLTNTIEMVLNFIEYKDDSVGYGSTEIPVKRVRIVDYDTLKTVN